MEPLVSEPRALVFRPAGVATSGGVEFNSQTGLIIYQDAARPLARFDADGSLACANLLDLHRAVDCLWRSVIAEARWRAPEVLAAPFTVSFGLGTAARGGVRLYPDGVVEYYGGYAPTPEARAAWDVVATARPRLVTSAQLLGLAPLPAR